MNSNIGPLLLWPQRSEVTYSPVFQYEDLTHYGLDTVGGVYGDTPAHPTARSLQAIHVPAGTYAPHQYSQSNQTSSVAGTSGDKDILYGYDQFTDLIKHSNSLHEY